MELRFDHNRMLEITNFYCMRRVLKGFFSKKKIFQHCPIFLSQYNSDETIEILSAYGDIYHSTPYQTPAQKIPPTTVMPINKVVEQKIEDTPRSTPTRGKKGLIIINFFP